MLQDPVYLNLGALQEGCAEATQARALRQRCCPPALLQGWILVLRLVKMSRSGPGCPTMLGRKHLGSGHPASSHGHAARGTDFRSQHKCHRSHEPPCCPASCWGHTSLRPAPGPPCLHGVTCSLHAGALPPAMPAVLPQHSPSALVLAACSLPFP